MTILSKAIYRFSAVSTKLPMEFFTKLEQKLLKFVWRQKRLWTAKAILRKKNRAECKQAPLLQTYYKTMVINQYGTGTKTEIQIDATG